MLPKLCVTDENHGGSKEKEKAWAGEMEKIEKSG